MIRVRTPLGVLARSEILGLLNFGCCIGSTDAEPSTCRGVAQTFADSIPGDRGPVATCPDSADLADGSKGHRQRDSVVVKFEIGSRGRVIPSRGAATNLDYRDPDF